MGDLIEKLPLQKKDLSSTLDFTKPHTSWSFVYNAWIHLWKGVWCWVNNSKTLHPMRLRITALSSQCLWRVCSFPVFLVSLPSAFGSLPCLAQTCPCNVKSTSCIDLSVAEPGPRPSSRPRVLLKAPTLAEMEEMNIFEVRRGRRSLNSEIIGICLSGLTGVSYSSTCFVSQPKWVKMPLCICRMAQSGNEAMIEINPLLFAERQLETITRLNLFSP